jgi:hypothetical protein
MDYTFGKGVQPMAKQKYVDRGGKEIKREVLEEYEVIGVQNYNSKTNVITILVERRKPPPVLGCAIIIVLSLILIAIGVWCVISLI